MNLRIITCTFFFLVVAGVSSLVSQSPDCQFDRRRGCTQNPVEEKMERERAKAQNKERQEALKKDADKLLALATELKDYVDKTNENVMSLNVIKKAEEIEKLAKSVRERMKAEGMMPGPTIEPPRR